MDLTRALIFNQPMNQNWHDSYVRVETIVPIRRYFQHRRTQSYPSPLNINSIQSKNTMEFTILKRPKIKEEKIRRAKKILKQALQSEELEKRYKNARMLGDITYPSTSLLRNIITEESRLREAVILWCHHHGKIKDKGSVSLALLPEDLFREYIIPMIYEF